MAYVSISQALRHDVQRVVRNMMQNELNALGEQPTVVISPTDELVTNVIWGKHVHLRNQIPREWTGEADTLHVRVTIPLPPEEDGTCGSIVADTTVYFPTHMRPRTPPRYSREWLHLQHDHVAVADFADWRLRAHEIHKRWNATSQQVTTFLTSCKSLNEALKLWPDIKFYVPNGYIEKVNEKTTRAAADKKSSNALEALQKMDTDQLVANAVIARMSKGS